MLDRVNPETLLQDTNVYRFRISAGKKALFRVAANMLLKNIPSASQTGTSKGYITFDVIPEAIGEDPTQNAGLSFRLASLLTKNGFAFTSKMRWTAGSPEREYIITAHNRPAPDTPTP